jgi:pimeloyl-[acyl-carrier protein] methyl ester esterase
LPHLLIPASPLAPGRSPVRIGYRDRGAGAPLVILHGGWGTLIYPFDRQIAALTGHRIIAPDRTGYGESETLDVQPVDFHQRAVEETIAVLDALGLERVSLWGHSDGAVIALRLALTRPDRVNRIVAEASHYFRRKPASREFFHTMRDRPDDLGTRVTSILEREHGARWRALISTNGSAWLHLADSAADSHADLYDGRLGDLRAPLLLVHGSADPRTEPGELDRLRACLPHAQLALLSGAGHSPHSERATADAVTDLVRRFLGDGSAALVQEE